MWKGAQQKKNENTTAADEHFYLFMLHICCIDCIKLYEENSTSAEEVDHFLRLDWSYKKSIPRLRGNKVLTLKVEIEAADVV